jgi:hypothetical protein
VPGETGLRLVSRHATFQSAESMHAANAEVFFESVSIRRHCLATAGQPADWHHHGKALAEMFADARAPRAKVLFVPPRDRPAAVEN